jgi:hypothetical protein
VAETTQQAIGAESGEIECPSCMERIAANGELRSELNQLRQELERAEVQKAGDAHTIGSLSYKLEELKRDKEAEAKEHELWDTILDLHSLWRHAAGEAEGKSKPKRSQLTGERFWLALPFLKKHGERMCQRAIIGRCFDHFTGKRGNGSPVHYLEWERIFGSKGQGATAAANFEESANRAPKDWEERLEALVERMAT